MLCVCPEPGNGKPGRAVFPLGSSGGAQMSALVMVARCEKPPKEVSRGASGIIRKREWLKEHYLVKKLYAWHLLKMVRKTLFKGVGQQQWGFVMRERNWTELWTEGKLGTYSQGRSGGSVDRKSLRGNIKDDKGDSRLTDLTGFLLMAGQGDQMSSAGWWRIRNLIWYHWW